MTGSASPRFSRSPRNLRRTAARAARHPAVQRGRGIWPQRRRRLHRRRPARGAGRQPDQYRGPRGQRPRLHVRDQRAQRRRDRALSPAATGRPYANSLTADFAKLIPNYTDVVVFKDRGWPTLSYAIVGNETRYHTPGDTGRGAEPAQPAAYGRAKCSPRRAPCHARAAPVGGSMPTSRAACCSPSRCCSRRSCSAGLVGGLGLDRRGERRRLGRPLLTSARRWSSQGWRWRFALAFVAGLVRSRRLLARLSARLPSRASTRRCLRRCSASSPGLAGRVERDKLRIAAWLLIAPARRAAFRSRSPAR